MLQMLLRTFKVFNTHTRTHTCTHTLTDFFFYSPNNSISGCIVYLTDRRAQRSTTCHVFKYLKLSGLNSKQITSYQQRSGKINWSKTTQECWSLQTRVSSTEMYRHMEDSHLTCWKRQVRHRSMCKITFRLYLKQKQAKCTIACGTARDGRVWK